MFHNEPLNCPVIMKTIILLNIKVLLNSLIDFLFTYCCTLLLCLHYWYNHDIGVISYNSSSYFTSLLHFSDSVRLKLHSCQNIFYEKNYYENIENNSFIKQNFKTKLCVYNSDYRYSFKVVILSSLTILHEIIGNPGQSGGVQGRFPRRGHWGVSWIL